MAYEINININADSGEISSTSGVAGGGATSAKTSSGDLGSKLGKYVATQTIEPIIQKTINFVTSNVELTTGSTELQQRIDFASQSIQTGISAFKNAQAGAVITSAMGLGGGIGLGIGIALTAINTGINILFKQRQLDLQDQEKDRERSYFRTRSGMAYSQSRRGA